MLLTQGGVYLSKLDPSKHNEVGKIRPVVVLTGQFLLNESPEIIFICPLSSQSYPGFSALHVELVARDGLLKTSYVLVEHCRSISSKRLIESKLAQLSTEEISLILARLQRLVGL